MRALVDSCISSCLIRGLRYDTPMKTPPDNPEFERFTDAMRTIVKVSKVELQRRMEAEKQTPKAVASRAFRARSVQPKPAN
jgi:hypothetical protein